MLISAHVEIDAGRCLGHGRCVMLCPELFDIDESGAGVVISSDVPDDLIGRVRQAVLNCPEQAITLVQRADSDLTSDQPTRTRANGEPS